MRGLIGVLCACLLIGSLGESVKAQAVDAQGVQADRVARHVECPCPQCEANRKQVALLSARSEPAESAETTTDVDATAIFGRNRMTFSGAVQQAIRESNEPFGKKLLSRLTMAVRPAIRSAVEEQCLDFVNEGGMSVASVDAQIDPDKLRELIDLLIEKMPQIIAMIEMLLKLFGSMEAAMLNEPVTLSDPVIWFEGFYELAT